MLTNEVKRLFIPGSEWLYYKLYCGNHTTDIILMEVVFPFVKQLLKEDLIKSWFFIRYSDPDNHLRIRFLMDDSKNFNDILGWFKESLDPYIKTRMIWKIQLDTYQREVERYGENTMEISETFFCNDSEQVLNFLTKIDLMDEILRYHFTVNNMRKILSCFLPNDTDEQFLFVKGNRDRYKKEFKAGKTVIRQLDEKYRVLKHVINSGEDSYDCSMEFSDSLLVISDKISTIRQRGELQVDYNDLICSYIHMSVNRIFNERQRLKEFVCYEFLYKDLKTLKFSTRG